METTTIDYENPTTNRMIYKSVKPRLGDPSLENTSNTDPLVDENTPATPSPEAGDIGSQTPTNLEANTEKNYALDTEPPVVVEVNNPDSKHGTDQTNPEGNTQNNKALFTEAPAATEVNNHVPIPGSDPPNLEVIAQNNKASVIESPAVSEGINPDPKFGTYLPNLDGKTESNKILDNEAPVVAEANIADPIIETHPPNLKVNTQSNKAFISPAMQSSSVTPSNKRGDFVLQEEDYLTKDSLVPVIRSSGGLEQVVKEYNEEVRKQCVLAKEASFAHMQDVFNKAKINSVVGFFINVFLKKMCIFSIFKSFFIHCLYLVYSILGSSV